MIYFNLSLWRLSLMLKLVYIFLFLLRNEMVWGLWQVLVINQVEWSLSVVHLQLLRQKIMFQNPDAPIHYLWRAPCLQIIYPGLEMIEKIKTICSTKRLLWFVIFLSRNGISVFSFVPIWWQHFFLSRFFGMNSMSGCSSSNFLCVHVCIRVVATACWQGEITNTVFGLKEIC